MPENYEERERYLILRESSEEAMQQEEYECWRYALSLIRHLEEKDFNFGDSFSEENIRSHIDWPISSYGMNKYDLEGLLAHYIQDKKN